MEVPYRPLENIIFLNSRPLLGSKVTELNCSLIRFVSSIDRPIHHVMEMDKDVTFDFEATAITRMASSYRLPVSIQFRFT